MTFIGANPICICCSKLPAFSTTISYLAALVYICHHHHLPTSTLSLGWTKLLRRQPLLRCPSLILKSLTKIDHICACVVWFTCATAAAVVISASLIIFTSFVKFWIRQMVYSEQWPWDWGACGVCYGLAVGLLALVWSLLRLPRNLRHFSVGDVALFYEF